MVVPASERLAKLPGRGVIASTAGAASPVYRIVFAARDRRFFDRACVGRATAIAAHSPVVMVKLIVIISSGPKITDPQRVAFCRL